MLFHEKRSSSNQIFRIREVCEMMVKIGFAFLEFKDLEMTHDRAVLLLRMTLGKGVGCLRGC